MKKIYSTLIIALSITLHGLDAIDDQKWQEFQEKFPHIAAITNHNKKLVNELKEIVDAKEYFVQDCFENAPKRVEEKIQQNNRGTLGLTALIPFAAAAGVGIRSVDWKKLYNKLNRDFFINKGLFLTRDALKQDMLLPKSIQKYVLSPQISRYGLNMQVNLLDVSLDYIIENKKELDAKKFVAIVAGNCIARIRKNESNTVMRFPGTQFVILKDSQGVRIAARSVGHLVTQGKIPSKKEVAYEIFKHTTTEVTYNTIAQLLYVIAERFEMENYLETFIPRDCKSPENLFQYYTKKGINWLTILSIESMSSRVTSDLKSVLHGCL